MGHLVHCIRIGYIVFKLIILMFDLKLFVYNYILEQLSNLNEVWSAVKGSFDFLGALLGSE